MQEIPDLSVPSEEPNVEPGWYALYTRHHHEGIVARALGSKGFEVFLPLYSADHRWKDRIKRLSLPLFPCYVFLRGPGERWLEILTTPGFHNIVGFGGQPAMIPWAEIDAIRRVVESPIKAEPHPYLKSGDRVRVIAGPLEGVEGILLRKKNLWKLVLSVEILQRSVSVEVDAMMVERVYAPKPGFAPRWQPAGAPARS